MSKTSKVVTKLVQQLGNYSNSCFVFYRLVKCLEHIYQNMLKIAPSLEVIMLLAADKLPHG